MCEYCEEQKIIYVEEIEGVCNLENFIEKDNTFCVNAYGHCHFATEEICYSFKINFCPMCGRKL